MEQLGYKLMPIWDTNACKVSTLAIRLLWWAPQKYLFEKQSYREGGEDRNLSTTSSFLKWLL